MNIARAILMLMMVAIVLFTLGYEVGQRDAYLKAAAIIESPANPQVTP